MYGFIYLGLRLKSVCRGGGRITVGYFMKKLCSENRVCVFCAFGRAKELFISSSSFFHVPVKFKRKLVQNKTKGIYIYL